MTSPDTYWNPLQYLKFSDHRLRPALELMERIPISRPRLVFDLGCGTGHVTRLLAERWPGAEVFGLDSSAEMLHQARGESSAVGWLQADIAAWRPDAAPDLIYSNAALQWLEDHATLFPRLFGEVRAGGCLAVQMPLSWDAPSHRLMRRTLADGGANGAALGPDSLRRTLARKWVDDAEAYYDRLAPLASRLDIWETQYLQVLEGDDAVLAWVQSTALRPVLNGLEAADRAVFLDQYRRRLRAAYPMRPDGRTLYPFRRLFIVAVKR